MTLRVLVVTSCTGEKRFKPDNQLLVEDFHDKERLACRERELSDFGSTAGEMYTGDQHAALMKGVKEYRKHGGLIDVAILSAGYGLLEENAAIVPYEVTFNSMSKTAIRAWAQQINITNDLQERIGDYDVIFFLLGGKYLESVEWPLSSPHQKIIFFASHTTKSKVMKQSNCSLLSIGKPEAKRFGSGFIEIKGLLFAKLLHAVTEHSDAWNKIYERPSTVREFILSAYSMSSHETYLHFEDFTNPTL